MGAPVRQPAVAQQRTTLSGSSPSTAMLEKNDPPYNDVIAAYAEAGVATGVPQILIRTTRTTNVRLAPSTRPVIIQQPSVGKMRPLAWNPVWP